MMTVINDIRNVKSNKNQNINNKFLYDKIWSHQIEKSVRGLEVWWWWSVSDSTGNGVQRNPQVLWDRGGPYSLPSFFHHFIVIVLCVWLFLLPPLYQHQHYVGFDLTFNFTLNHRLYTKIKGAHVFNFDIFSHINLLSNF